MKKSFMLLLCLLFAMCGVLSADALISENFDGGTDLPTGWSAIDNDGDEHAWMVFETATAHSGGNVARIRWNGDGNDDYLVTPQVTVRENEVIQFWARSQGTSFLEDFNLVASTSGNAVADFTITIDTVRQISSEWTRFTYQLNDISEISTDDQVYFAVQCVSNDEYYMQLDDFVVDQISLTPEAAVNPTTYAFGVSEINETVVSDTFKLSNVGFQTLTASGISDLASTDFTTSFVAADVSCGVGEEYAFTVSYNPTVVEEDSLDITINTNGGDVTFTVTGTGHLTEYGNVAGTVTAEDGGANLEGVVVSVAGKADTTGADGAYEIQDIVTGDYTVTATKAGYLNETADVAITANNTTDQDFAMEVIPDQTPVLTATLENEDDVHLSWYLPNPNEHEFRYDDDTVVGQLGFGENPAAVLGAAHNYDAVINEVKWMLTSNAAHTEAKIYIIGLQADGTPDDGNILHESAMLPNTDDAWNTYTLATPIEAPNGFFVGVCTPGVFTAIAKDDGVGAPYESQAGRNFGIADVTAGTNTWLDLHGTEFQGNFMVRAYGANNGALASRNYVVNRNLDYSELVGTSCEPFVPEMKRNSVASRELTGFKVMKNDVEAATVAADVFTYDFTDLEPDTYNFKIIADYTDEDKTSNIETITIEAPIPDAPISLTATFNAPNVDLEWAMPGEGGGSASFSDDFEDNFDGWGEVVAGPGTPGEGGTPNWFVSAPDGDPYDGNCARVDWGYTIDTWLISPAISIDASTTIDFDWYGSYTWTVDPNDNSDLFVKVSTDDGATWTPVWTNGDIGVWENFTWYETSLQSEISDYVGQSVKVAFNVVGDDNAVTCLDNVTIGAGSRTEGTIALGHSNNTLSTEKKIGQLAVVSTRESRALQGFKIFMDGNLVHELTDASARTYTHQDVEAGAHVYTVKAVYDEGDSPASPQAAVVVSDNEQVENFVTSYNGNYPNPFNPTTSINFSIAKASNVSLVIYNVKGQVVKTLANEEMEAGEHNVQWNGNDNNGKDVASGVYYVRMNTANYTKTSKMLLMK
jgi:hypothetical protein